MKKTDEFISHLKATGRFQAFKAQRKALEAENIPKHQAWEQAAKSFGWGDNWTPDETEQPPEDSIDEAPAAPPAPSRPTLPTTIGDTVSVHADMEWAYYHVGLSEDELYEAEGATGPRVEAVKYAQAENKNFRQLVDWLVKIRAGEDEGEEERQIEADRKRQFALLDGFLEAEQERIEAHQELKPKTADTTNAG